MNSTQVHREVTGRAVLTPTSFKIAHPDEHAWIEAKKGSFEFAAAMAEDVERWGFLSPNKLAAIRRCMDRAKSEATAKQVPMATMAQIEQAFAAAIGAGIKRPKLRLDSYLFKPAGGNTSNAGAIYVMEGETYLGKVMGGKFLRSRDCADEQEGRIVAAASDPLAAAVAYGQRTGNCAVCNRPLTLTQSVDIGIGPVCRDRMGWFE